MVQLGYQTSVDEMRGRLQTVLAHPDYATFSAVSLEAVVGVAGGRIGHYYERNGSYGQLLVIAVDEAWRGRGAGALLMRAVEGWFRGKNADLVVVNSGLRRREAHRFYQKQGYEKTGVRLVKSLQ